MAGLVLSGISKIYPSGAQALYDINLHLGDGEFVAVVGGEKSGKSTLLRVIAGLETADGGRIELGGKDITELDSRERDIAMIFNGNTLSPSLSIGDNIAYGLRMRKASPVLIERRVKAAADILGLTGLLARKPRTVTSAQRQKTAFARAIVREPRLYLLDDPLSGFDGTLKAEMADVIINLQARMSGTFLYATKNVTDAMSMATRIVVLEDGMIQQTDTPANLYDYPANTYVAFLIGSPTVNFIDGATIERDDGGVCACFGGERMPVPAEITARFEDIDGYIGTGRKVILGIRPEDITSGGDGYAFSCRAGECQTAGGKTYVNCETAGGILLTAAASGEKGAAITLVPDLSHLMIFDGDTRLTLLARDGGYVKTGYADADRKPLSFRERENVKKKRAPSGEKRGRSGRR